MKVQKIDIKENIIINLFFCVTLSHKVCIVSHKIVLSCKVVLSCQVVCRSAQVVSK